MVTKQRKLQIITLSADIDLIAKARIRAEENNSTLNEAFRAWLEYFTRPITSKDEYLSLMQELSGVLSGAGFLRDEASERC